MVIHPVLICCFFKKIIFTFILTCSESSETFSRFVVSLFNQPLARQAPLPMELSRQEYWSG